MKVQVELRTEKGTLFEQIFIEESRLDKEFAFQNNEVKKE